MKHWYLALILFASCSLETPIGKDLVPQKDTTLSNNILIEMDSIQANLIRTKVDNVELRSERDSDIIYIRTLQTQVKELQNDKVELIIVQSNLLKFKTKSKVLLNKIEVLNQLLQYSRDSNEEVNKKLETEKAYGKQVTHERNLAQSKVDAASKLTVAGVTVKSYGTKKPLFGHKYQIENDKASEVNQVIISFILPQNKLFIPKSFNIKAVIHGNNQEKGVTESITVTYNGTEQEHSIPFNQVKEWRAVEHRVELFNDTELLWTGKLILK